MGQFDHSNIYLGVICSNRMSEIYLLALLSTYTFTIEFGRISPFEFYKALKSQ
jgi:hypothetical protein